MYRWGGGGVMYIKKVGERVGRGNGVEWICTWVYREVCVEVSGADV